jgi:hypothetical protein
MRRAPAVQVRPGAPALGEVLSKINLWFKGEREREPCPVQTHDNASEGVAGPPPQSCRRAAPDGWPCGPMPAPWSCLRRAWGRNLAPPLASRPNPDGQPTVFCAPRRVRPEVGTFLIWGLGGEVAENPNNGGAFLQSCFPTFAGGEARGKWITQERGIPAPMAAR